jgi:hypothetical protein
MNNILKFVLGVSVLLLSSQAFAMPLTGQIVLTGAGMYYDGDSDGVVDGIDVVTATNVAGTGWGTAGEVEVGFGTTGTFSSLFSLGTTGAMNDIDFAASSVSPLWTVGTLSFDLMSFTANPVASGYEIVGSGLITDSTGTYDATYGAFTLNTSSSDARFSFDATTTVPEPGAIALLGMGLLAMGMVSTGRRRNSM